MTIQNDLRRWISLLEDQNEQEDDEPDILATNRRRKYLGLLRRSSIAELGPVSKITMVRALDRYGRPMTSKIYFWFDYLHVNDFKTWPIARLRVSVPIDETSLAIDVAMADMFLKDRNHVGAAAMSSENDIAAWLESITLLSDFKVDDIVVARARRLLFDLGGQALLAYANFAKKLSDRSNAEFIPWNRQGRAVIYSKDGR